MVDQLYADVSSLMEDNVSNASEHQLYGDHETQVSEGGEADLHKLHIECKKNPGHTEFIPVDTFTLNHLPEGHRDTDLYKCIKATADLTVRIDVKTISHCRPEFWPNTKVPYPFYTTRGENNWRTGSGTIYEIYNFTDGENQFGCKHEKNYTTCWCKECQRSGTASHVWWEFYVSTATHVVFDDIEASHTSLRLFYDNEESPVVNVDQISVGYSGIDSDYRSLFCVICDKSLGDKINNAWKHFKSIWEKVKDKYREYRDVDKLNFIVSHPHGCCKQVSVGQWVDKYILDNYNLEYKHYKFTYTTSTCPGSSGAAVVCVGYKGCRSWNQLVHSGSLNSQINYSGTGRVD